MVLREIKVIKTTTCNCSLTYHPGTHSPAANVEIWPISLQEVSVWERDGNEEDRFSNLHRMKDDLTLSPLAGNSNKKERVVSCRGRHFLKIILWIPNSIWNPDCFQFLFYL